MSDETEVEIENYEEVIGVYHNSTQPTVGTPCGRIYISTQQTTSHHNSYDG